MTDSIQYFVNWCREAEDVSRHVFEFEKTRMIDCGKKVDGWIAEVTVYYDKTACHKIAKYDPSSIAYMDNMFGYATGGRSNVQRTKRKAKIEAIKMCMQQRTY